MPQWMQTEFLLSKACWFFANAMTSTPTWQYVEYCVQVGIDETAVDLGGVFDFSRNAGLSWITGFACGKDEASCAIAPLVRADYQLPTTSLHIGDLLEGSDIQAELVNLSGPAFEEFFARTLLEADVALLCDVLGFCEDQLALGHRVDSLGQVVGFEDDCTEPEFLGRSSRSETG